MKAKDIKPGVVYAHQRGRSEYATVRAVVFLAPADSDHLYSTTSHHRPKGSPAFVKMPSGSKPKRGHGWSAPNVGYPIITGPVEALKAVTLADFEAATSMYLDAESGVTFEVLTSLTSVTGLYEEIVAERKQQQEKTERARDEQREREQAHADRLDAQQRRLQKLGIGSTRTSVLTGPDMVAISANDLDKLLALLDDKEASAARQPVPPTHNYAGSSPERQRVGDPGHCEECAIHGHVVAHPDLGCGDVGCAKPHSEEV